MGNIEEEYRYVNAKIASVPLLKFFIRNVLDL